MGVPAPPPEPAGPVQRDARGRFVPGAATSAASLGGRAKARRNPKHAAAELRLLRDPLVGTPFASAAAEPVLRACLKAREAWLRAQAATLASDVGGGAVGPAPMALLAAAARKYAGADWLFALAGLNAVAWDRSDAQAPRPRTDVLASAARLTDSARQDVLAAHELAAREAAARRSRPQGGLSIVELIAAGHFAAAAEGDDDEPATEAEAEEQDAPAEPAEGDGR